jgi:drug/metabolite transporter (DMT)-like permease
MSLPRHRDRVLAGIAAMLASVVMFAVVYTLVKWLGARYPLAQLMFFRCALALVPVMLLMRRDPRGFALMRPTRPLGHLVRSGAGLIAMAASFAAFRYLPAADVIAINFAAPIFVTALSVPLLGESVGWRRWIAVFVGFAGVVIMLQPGALLAGTDPGAAIGGGLALGAAVTYAIVVIAIRRMSRDEPGETIVFVYMTAVALATLPVLPFVWVTPASLLDLALLVALGLVGGIAQIFMTRAVQIAPPAAIMPFEYFSLLATGSLAWAIWGELPSAGAVTGGAVVIGCGLFILRREARLARLRPPSAP